MTGTYRVVSPHLDDSVLSCSLLLAASPGSTIVTAFTAGPPSVRPLPSWDRAAKYFPEGADVMRVRRGEDISAAAMVGASACHLGYWDRQYRSERYGYQGLADDALPEAIAQDLAAQATGHPGQSWLLPLGLGHPDHRLAAEAGLIFAAGHPGTCYLFAELPYAAADPAEVSARQASLAERGFGLVQVRAGQGAQEELRVSHDWARKAAAVGCHASQCRALGRRRVRTAIRTPERFWRLIPP